MFQIRYVNIEGLVPDDDSVRLLSHELENLVKIYTGEDESMETWEKITIASTIGGIVITMAGVTLAHGMANNPVVFTEEEIAEIYKKAL